MTTVTGAEFNRRPSQIKRAAATEPVIITEHDIPSYVLLSFAEYERLRSTPSDLARALEMPDDIDFDIEPVGLRIEPAE